VALQKRKRTEVTIQTREFIVLHTSASGRTLLRCSECGKKSPMLGVDAAARVAGVSVRTMCRWVEAGKVHFVETPAGQLLVCARSLPAERT
jgi:hypothetical protein